VLLVLVFSAAGPAGSAVRSTAGTGELVGCYVDKGDPQGLHGRDLSGASSRNNPQMTVERCLRYCEVMGFRYAGVQYANSCFCGNSYGSYGLSDACNMPCAGNASQICGGTWANSIYKLNGEVGPPFGLNE